MVRKKNMWNRCERLIKFEKEWGGHGVSHQANNYEEE